MTPNTTPKESLWTRNFILICLAHLAISFSFYATMPIMPLFLESRLGVSGLLMGALVASYTVTATLIRPFAGYVLDRTGRMRVYVPSYLIFGLLFFLYPLAGSVLLLLVLRLAHGVLWGSVMGAANTLAVDLVPASRRGEGIGMFGLTMTLGMAVGPAIGIPVSDYFGYDGLFIMGGLLMAAGLVLALRIKAPQVPLERRPFLWKNLLEKTSIPVSCVTILACIAFGAMMNYTALYVTTEVAGAAAGLYFLCLAIGMGVARMTAGKAFDRSGPGKSMALAYGCLLGGFALQALTREALPFYASGMLIGTGFGIATPVWQAMVNIMVSPDRRGAANATFMTAFDTGICLGILIIGFVQKQFGWEASHAVDIMALLASAALFWGWGMRHYAGMTKPSRENGTN